MLASPRFARKSPAGLGEHRHTLGHRRRVRAVRRAVANSSHDALQDACEKRGVPTRVQSAIHMAQVAEPYIPRRAERHMEKGRLVIVGAGSGMPYFSTDTVAAQRALEIGAEILLMGKQGVDGVYDSDPNVNPDAKMFDTLSYDEFLARDLKVADATAIALARDNNLDIKFFNLSTPGNIARVVAGESIGTFLTQ